MEEEVKKKSDFSSQGRAGWIRHHSPIENPRLLNTKSKNCQSAETMSSEESRHRHRLEGAQGKESRVTLKKVSDPAHDIAIDTNKSEAIIPAYKCARISEKTGAPQKRQLIKSLQGAASSQFGACVSYPDIMFQSVYEILSQQQITTQTNQQQNENARKNLPVHMKACQFKEILWLPGLFTNSNIPTRDNADISQEICFTDEEDESVKMTCSYSNVEIYIEKEALHEMKPDHSAGVGAETIKLCFVEQLNSRWNLDSSGYLGDNEEAEEDQNMNANQNKKFRKRFGVYPLYRIRFNGVEWMSCESSDEEGYDRSMSKNECRGSRRLKLASKNSESPKPKKPSYRASYNEENDEESEPLIVHVVSDKRRKKLTKQMPDFNSTTSGASDMESLTDCSLCYSDNLQA